MKALHSHLSKENLLIALLLLSLPVFIYSCSGKALSASPLRFGYGVDIAPGIQLGDSKGSVHALLGYGRIGFKGGGGHNNLWQFGGQFRRSFADKPTDNGFWAGAEASYVSIHNKYDNSSVKQTASGFTAGGLAGYRFLVGKIPVSFYAAPAFLSRGKFKTNGMSSGTSGTGFLGRIGFDIHFASLLGKKGR